MEWARSAREAAQSSTGPGMTTVSETTGRQQGIEIDFGAGERFVSHGCHPLTCRTTSMTEPSR